MTKIARVEAFPLRYAEPHDSNNNRHVTLARIETDDGAVGWGEAVTNPPEAGLATKVLIDAGLGELLIGQDPSDPRRLWRSLRRHSGWSGHGGIVSFAISALDTAVWDLAGKIAGQPVHRLLGGKLHDRVRACSSVILNTLDLDALGEEFSDYRKRGFTAMKGGWGLKTEAGFVGVAGLQYQTQEERDHRYLLADGRIERHGKARSSLGPRGFARFEAPFGAGAGGTKTRPKFAPATHCCTTASLSATVNEPVDVGANAAPGRRRSPVALRAGICHGDFQVARARRRDVAARGSASPAP